MIEEPVLEMMPMQWQAVLDVNRDEDDVAICWWHQVWLMEIHRDVDKLRRILAATIWDTYKDENEADRNEFETFILKWGRPMGFESNFVFLYIRETKMEF